MGDMNKQKNKKNKKIQNYMGILSHPQQIDSNAKQRNAFLVESSNLVLHSFVVFVTVRS